MKRKLIAALLGAVALASCSDVEHGAAPSRHPYKYRNGFYVLNEGQYGMPASVNYWTPEGWRLEIFAAGNGGRRLGNTGVMAVCDAAHMYIVTKGAPCLVKVALDDFGAEAELDGSFGTVEAKACGFALLDETRGVLTTTDGAYVVDLASLRLGTRFFAYAGDDTTGGDVAVYGGRIFLLAGGTVRVYDAETLAAVDPNLCAAKTGFAVADGALWAADGDRLVRIDPATLRCETSSLGSGYSVHYNAWNYTPTGLCASKAGDALYFANSVGVESDGYVSYYGRTICRFTIATKQVSEVFDAPVASGGQMSTYGAGVHVDPRTGDLCLVYTEDGWGDHYLNTDICVVDPESGRLRRTIPYTREDETVLWFPSQLIFR